MKLRLCSIVLFLLLGGMINVAIAWGLARSVHIRRGDRPNLVAKGYSSLSSAGAYWRIEIRKEFGSTVIIGSVSLRASRISNIASVPSELLPAWSAFRKPPEKPNPKWVVFEDARGWPMRALSCQQRRFSGPSGYVVLDGLDLGRRPSFRAPPRIALPLRPLWAGFTVNTVFYAALLWLPVGGRLALRRFFRRKRGLCINCGYDVRGDFVQGCPECGWRRQEKDAQQPA